MSRRHAHIPAGDIPFGEIPVTERAHWEDYNSLGYRTPELAPPGRLNLVALGDSWTEGRSSGHPLVRSYVDHLADALGGQLGEEVVRYNLAIGGRSNDSMARTLLCSIDRLRPCFAFVCFTTLDRREYWRVDGKRIAYLSAYIEAERVDHEEWRRLSASDRDLVRALNALVSPYDDTVNFLRNYKLIELLLEQKKILWGFSMIDLDTVREPIAELMEMGWLDASRYLGAPFRMLDRLAPHDRHPGPGSHEAFGREIAAWFARRYASELEALRVKPRGPAPSGA